MIQRYHNGFVLMQVVNNGQNQLPKGGVRGGTSIQDGKVMVCVTANPAIPLPPTRLHHLWQVLGTPKIRLTQAGRSWSQRCSLTGRG